MKGELCPLCNSTTKAFFTDKKERKYRHCNFCDGIFLMPQFHLTKKEEFARYKTHNNFIHDKLYQNFVSDLCNLVIKNEKKNTLGLDFGCGPGPVIQYILLKQGFHILTYDPFYQPDNSVLNKIYDYVVLCEVIEHFNRPFEAFTTLKKLLKTGATLYIKTDVFYEVSIASFEKWGYRNDPTHVFFYTPKTFSFIKDKFQFSSIQLNGRTVVYTDHK